MIAAGPDLDPLRIRPGQTLALLCLFAALGLLGGCRDGRTAGLPMPRKIVDLSPPLTEDIAVRQFGHRACEFLGLPERFRFTPLVPANPDYAFGLTRFELVSHLGAHLDAPGRLDENGARADQVSLSKLYGPAQVLDLRWKDRQSELQVTDLENYSSQIGRNEILILYVGYNQPKDEDWPAYPPLSVEAAEWLVDKGIKALATDMPSIGSFSRYADLMDKGRPPAEVWAERLPFLEKEIPIVEGLTNLSKLLAEENIVFAGFPLPIADRNGAPMRAAALIF
jgi:kynurenine formamidase